MCLAAEDLILAVNAVEGEALWLLESSGDPLRVFPSTIRQFVRVPGECLGGGFISPGEGDYPTAPVFGQDAFDSEDSAAAGL